MGCNSPMPSGDLGATLGDLGRPYSPPLNKGRVGDLLSAGGRVAPWRRAAVPYARGPALAHTVLARLGLASAPRCPRDASPLVLDGRAQRRAERTLAALGDALLGGGARGGQTRRRRQLEGYVSRRTEAAAAGAAPTFGEGRRSEPRGMTADTGDRAEVVCSRFAAITRDAITVHRGNAILLRLCCIRCQSIQRAAK